MQWERSSWACIIVVGQIVLRTPWRRCEFAKNLTGEIGRVIYDYLQCIAPLCRANPFLPADTLFARRRTFLGKPLSVPAQPLLLVFTFAVLLLSCSRPAGLKQRTGSSKKWTNATHAGRRAAWKDLLASAWPVRRPSSQEAPTMTQPEKRCWRQGARTAASHWAPKAPGWRPKRMSVTWPLSTRRK